VVETTFETESMRRNSSLSSVRSTVAERDDALRIGNARGTMMLVSEQESDTIGDFCSTKSEHSAQQTHATRKQLAYLARYYLVYSIYAANNTHTTGEAGTGYCHRLSHSDNNVRCLLVKRAKSRPPLCIFHY